MRVCSQCDHAAFNSYGVYCTFFNEGIWNEAVAEECPEFEPERPTLTVVQPDQEALR